MYRLDSQGMALEIFPGLAEHILIRTGAGEVDEDAAYGAFELCAYLEEFEADGSAGRFCEAGALERDAA